MIISDSGPIISFARANALSLLKRVVKKLIIPQAVYKEIVLDGKGKPGEKEVKAGIWISREPIEDATQLASLPSNLGAGEKEAILLAQERSAFLLIDEYTPRKEAVRRGIRLISSVDILQEAKDRYLIPEVKGLLDEFIHTGFRLSRKLYRDILKRGGEY